ncbi:MAG TPA: protein kinase [Bryobacteraceae bacterium]|nr:protein kinase [Bryobacteraceae bacterium]
MTAERWHQVRDLLYAASQLDAGARLAYLNANCADDAALREEVERLLAALDRSGGFLEPDSRDPQNSRRIGHYLILDCAGRGGMGVVYHAVREDDYRQEVAIKLVRAGAETDFLVARFRLERQALALLNHPNIARLLDGGTTPDGRPYLVMEWVEGRPITEHCRTHQLGLGERLQLFLDVGEAVEHAHRNLVVHRDLKPSNILITAEGRPKLLDFGIAKIFTPEVTNEPVTMTLAGARLLTPDYASPEQVRGHAVTTATDVYSLGAVLYELMTGARPLRFETRAPAEIERAVCTQEPLPPSAATGASGIAARELRGDLDNIVLKALQKEPQRRYGSVHQLCEDIRRHLEGRPVVARKDTVAYRAGKFVRRHRAGAVAAVLVFTAVLAGAGTTLWEARVAVEQRRRAERRFNDVRRLANSFLFEFHDAIRDLPGSTPARSLVVKRALEYLDSLAAEGRGDPSLQAEIASAYQRVGELQGDPMFPNLGDSRGALASSNKALAIREALVRADPRNPQLRLALASVHQQLSGILHFTGDSAGAIEHSGKALQIYEDLARTLANDPKFATNLMTQNYRHADLLRTAGDLDRAAAEYARAAELSERFITAHPSDREGKIHLAASLDGLGGVLQETGDTAAALANRQKGLAIREQLAAADPDNAHFRRQLAFSHHNVGLSLVETGDLSSALSHFRRELSLFRSLSAADPKDAQARRNQSLAYKQIGDVLMRNGDPNGALVEYRKSLDIDHNLSAADPGNSQALLDLSFSESKVGSALGQLRKVPEALAMLRSGVARQEALAAKDPGHILLYGHLANSYTRLAHCLLQNGDGRTAIPYYRKAVAARLKLAEKNRASRTNRGALAECHTNLAKALAARDSMDALTEYGKAIALLDPLSATDHANAQYRIHLADALTNAARLYARMASANNTALSLRLEQASKAQTFYQRSRQLWLELERGGRLPAPERRRPRDVERELAGLNESLAKLQQVQ